MLLLINVLDADIESRVPSPAPYYSLQASISVCNSLKTERKLRFLFQRNPLLSTPIILQVYAK